jgi:hypothetical protein
MNMQQMASREAQEIREEREYKAWHLKVVHAMGRNVDSDGLAWSLFKDGCDVADAVIELADEA